MNYWLVSAGKDGELWSAFWLEKLVAIGPSQIPDLRTFQTRDELKAAHKKVFPSAKPKQRGADVGHLWDFRDRIKPGELLFVRSYTALLGLGEVQGAYEYVAPSSDLRKRLRSEFFGDDFPHIRRVRWVSLGGGMKQSSALTRLTVME